MKLAIDSSVLLAIFNAEAGAEAWLESLIAARRERQLIICEIVFAELAPAFPSRQSLDQALAALGLTSEPINRDAAWLAGSIFKAYRKEGGPRVHMIPDFLIAAHAQIQCQQLATIDRGYVRRYFPDLFVFSPRLSR